MPQAMVLFVPTAIWHCNGVPRGDVGDVPLHPRFGFAGVDDRKLLSCMRVCRHTFARAWATQFGEAVGAVVGGDDGGDVAWLGEFV